MATRQYSPLRQRKHKTNTKDQASISSRGSMTSISNDGNADLSQKMNSQSGHSREPESFEDPTFPPDKSSLSYVYSGDDRYERMTFARPKCLVPNPVFVGTGGVCDEPMPWQTWSTEWWIKLAAGIVCLNSKYMERLFVQYDQSFTKNQKGLFRFNIWRFGKWQTVIVDDNLPVLDGELAFCRPIGKMQEFWAPLLEKAYAKCFRAYEVIEAGDTLDALTDFTGSICEKYTTSMPNLFLILYKSFLNSSMIVTWKKQCQVPDDELPLTNTQYLWLVSSIITITDAEGRVREMVKLFCPYTVSTNTNQSRKHTHFDDLPEDKPGKWLSFEMFVENYDACIICSSPVTFHLDYEVSLYSQTRTYESDNEEVFQTNKERAYSNDTPRCSKREHEKSQNLYFCERRQSKAQSLEIVVTEGLGTVKIDCTDEGGSKIAENSSVFKIRSSSINSTRTRSACNYDMFLAENSSVESNYDFRRRHSHQSRMPNEHKNKEQQNSLWSQLKDRRRFSAVSPTSSGSDLSINAESVSVSDAVLSVDSYGTDGFERPRFDSQGMRSSGQSGNCFEERCWKVLVFQRGNWQNSVDKPQGNGNLRIRLNLSSTNNSKDKKYVQKKTHILISLMQVQNTSSGYTMSLKAGFTIYKLNHIEKDMKKDLSKLRNVYQYESKRKSRDLTARVDLEPGQYIIVPYVKDPHYKGDFLLRVLGESE